jgi:alkylation response protein AidB-like acyl-CoA dehydrogenase
VPYNLDPKQQAIRDAVKPFAEEHILPVAAEMDRQPDPPVFPKEFYQKLCDQGWPLFPMKKEYGGGGYSFIEYVTLIEELCYYDPPTCLLAAVTELASHPIEAFASEEQKGEWLPRIASGEVLPAFALTEPDAGSDAANNQLSATIDGDDFVLDGEKIFIMHGDVADLLVVFCRVREGDELERKMSVVLVEAPVDGLRRETLKHKMGMRVATTGRLWFDGVRVPRSNLLGERGKGFRYAMATLDSARVGVAAQGVGIAQRALDESIAYAKKRVAFGAPIARLQAIQWMIADMSTRLEAARALTYKAATMHDEGGRYTIEACQAKLYASETAGFCVDRAMQIHGGYGYIGEFSPIEKLFRDQRVLEIYEGTSEIQRLVIGSTLLR